MTLKPPTRTLPKLVMKEWPEPGSPGTCGACKSFDDRQGGWCRNMAATLGGIVQTSPSSTCNWYSSKALSDFTRVVEETGILDQERSQKEGS